MDYESTNVEAAAYLAREADPGDWADEPSAADLAAEREHPGEYATDYILAADYLRGCPDTIDHPF